jgi:hypothetical protein
MRQGRENVNRSVEYGFSPQTGRMARGAAQNLGRSFLKCILFNVLRGT